MEDLKLVIPVSHVDIKNAEAMAWILRKMGRHGDVILVSSWETQWDLDRLKERIEPLHTHIIPTRNEMGWPESSNHMFYHAALYLRELGNHSPWLFMEADMMPLQQEWWYSLREEYYRIGKPYMGTIGARVFMNPNTKEKWIDGKHMVGAGIYPADFLTVCNSIHLVDRLPWDIQIGPEILEDVHHSELFAHRWSTCNYRRGEDGLLIMDDVPKPDVDSRIKPVPTNAVILHGVKDFSLAKILNDDMENHVEIKHLGK